MQTYPTGYTESHRMAEHIFRDVLPRRGMVVREEQIALCHEILDTLYNKEISLCEAGVGIGKTLAYLVACVLWQMNRPDRLKLPVVISTSSVALQDAIINDYLPNLSAILLEERIIQAPLTAVIRKGKERFVCDVRLTERASQIPATRKRQRNSLHMAQRTLDMDHIPELSRFDRSRICVPQSCPQDCILHESCRFRQYLRDSMKPDIQICNHNYLLANAAHDLFHFYRKEVAMKLGEKIKLVRKHRELTQRELGERLHLDGNAANRIAQYESGFRTPKESRTKEIAKALNVREENFFTRAETPEDIIRTLIWYDWEHGCGGSVPIDTILLFDDFEEVEKLLKEWYSQKERLRTRKIIKAKYLEWMLQWPTEKEN